MSRDVPMDRALSEEDRTYLHARGQHQTVDMLDERFGVLDDDTEVLDDDTEVAVDTDYENWTVQDLKDELKDRQLPVSGKQEELAARLREHDAANQ
jgi:hypothetical protein